MSIRELDPIYAIQMEVHKVAKEKGWWDNPRSIGEALMLVNCELAEAMEEYRIHGTNNPSYKVNDKPEGLAIELADAIIRILDLAEHYGLDIGRAIEEKHKYNMTRPYRHGNKNA